MKNQEILDFLVNLSIPFSGVNLSVPFGVIKHLWGYRKVRYRGLEKNAAQVFALFALANFYLARRELAAT